MLNFNMIDLVAAHQAEQAAIAIEKMGWTALRQWNYKYGTLDGATRANQMRTACDIWAEHAHTNFQLDEYRLRTGEDPEQADFYYL